MPAFVEPGDPQARHLVLRPIRSDGPDGIVHRSVAGEGSGEPDQEWEFADPWGTNEGSASALAVTRRVSDAVILLWVWVSDAAPAETIRLLVDQLVAVLRRTDASMICSSVENAAVRKELLAAGFVLLPGELGGQSRRIILQL